jgi:8-oxo-dGTP pyrophosphatase MutT (NUDIX family)
MLACGFYVLWKAPLKQEEQMEKIRKYEIVKRETVYEGRFLRCLILTYRDPEGILRQWEAVERVNCDGIVAIVPVTGEGEMILIRQFRPPVDAYVIEFPAGLNDRGENAEEVASRELLEETGYEAKEMTFLAKGPLSSGSSREVLTVYLAKGLEFKGIVQREETEDIEVMKIPVDAVFETLSRLAEEGNLVDLKILGLIEMARKHLCLL